MVQSGPTQNLYLAKARHFMTHFSKAKSGIGPHGIYLPQKYTISLLFSREDKYRTDQPGRPKWQRKKLVPQLKRTEKQQASSSEDEIDTSSSSSLSAPVTVLRKDHLRSFRRTSPPLKGHLRMTPTPSHQDNPETRGKPSFKPEFSQTKSPSRFKPANTPIDSSTALSSSENGAELETIRLTNAYPGATNTIIRSIHQRRWLLAFDRYNSGFVPQQHRDKTTHHQKGWVRR